MCFGSGQLSLGQGYPWDPGDGPQGCLLSKQAKQSLLCPKGPGCSTSLPGLTAKSFVYSTLGSICLLLLSEKAGGSTKNNLG